ncbi:MAG: hypothetical protein ABH967_00760 [Patescibacteria group bacterium]
MSKKFKILFGFLFVLLSVGGVFLWQENQETPPKDWDTANKSLYEDYIVKDLDNKRIVYNEKMELDFEIPDKWIVQEKEDFYMPYISFHSADMKIGSPSYLIESGCAISVSASDVKTNINTIEKVLRESWAESNLKNIETVQISGKSSLRYKICLIGDAFTKCEIGLSIPNNSKFYEISLSYAFFEEERCEEEFNIFSKTIKIN